MSVYMVEVTRAYKVEALNEDEAFTKVAVGVRSEDTITDPAVKYGDWEEITAVYQEDHDDSWGPA